MPPEEDLPSRTTVRALFDELPDGVVVHQLGRILYVNPSMLKLLGLQCAEDLVGTPALDLVHPEDRPMVVARVHESLETGARAAPIEERFLRKDGSTFVAEVYAVPFIFEDEPAMVAVVRDISDRLEIQRRLLLADRMASLGTLAAGVAHEINTPLSFILHNVNFARARLEQTRGAPGAVDEVLSALADAEEGSQRVRQIVRALNVFTRNAGESPGTVDVCHAVRSAIQMVRAEVRHRAQLVEELEAVPAVRGDELRIAQVMVNLLLNAAHAIPEDAAEKNLIRVKVSLQPDQRVALEVRDTGVGIAPEIRGRLFDPFFTTKPMGQGTGLGLAISHAIVSGLGGEIEVESEPGRGSTFRVLLPCVAREERVAEAASPLQVRARRGRILIVDDEPRFGASLARLLDSEHSVTVLTSATEASSRIAAGEQYDLILCDLMMPEMSGIEFFEAVSRTAPAMAQRTVFLTGGAFTEKARTFLARTRNRHLEKPIDLTALGWLLVEAMGPASPQKTNGTST